MNNKTMVAVTAIIIAGLVVLGIWLWRTKEPALAPPVEPEQAPPILPYQDISELIDALKDNKPEFIKKITIDTSTARNREEVVVAGNSLFVDNPATPSSPVYIRFNEPEAPELELTRMREVSGPFYRFFITNAAGTGTLRLIVSRGYQFRFHSVEVLTSIEPETTIANVERYSGSDTSTQEVCSWTVTAGKTGILREISMIADEVDHAEFTVSIGGIALFTDQKFQSALTLVFPDIKLVAGVEVKVEVQSDDGTAIVVDAAISGKEVG